MSTLFIFVHGFKGSYKSLFIPLLRERLTALGFPSSSETFPNPENPVYEDWKAAFLDQVKRTWSGQKIVLTGHSIGGYAILRFASECADSDWAKAIVGIVTVGAVAVPDPLDFCSGPIQWERLRGLGCKVVAIYSDDDPAVTPDNHAKICEELGSVPGFEGTVYHGFGHFRVPEAEPITNAVLGFAK
jgi:predicted alpha/beta hydrolase family esterase